MPSSSPSLTPLAVEEGRRWSQTAMARHHTPPGPTTHTQCTRTMRLCVFGAQPWCLVSPHRGRRHGPDSEVHQGDGLPWHPCVVNDSEVTPLGQQWLRSHPSRPSSKAVWPTGRAPPSGYRPDRMVHPPRNATHAGRPGSKAHQGSIGPLAPARQARLKSPPGK